MAISRIARKRKLKFFAWEDWSECNETCCSVCFVVIDVNLRLSKDGVGFVAEDWKGRWSGFAAEVSVKEVLRRRRR